MELREYLKIFKKNLSIFFFWGGLIFVSLMIFYFQTEKTFVASFSLDLSRKTIEDRSAEKGIDNENDQSQKQVLGKVESDNYDHYYRLRADEDFGKRISKWAEDEAIKEAILNKAREKGLVFANEAEERKVFGRSFQLEQLAPGYLKISWKTKNPDQAGKLSEAVKEVISQKIAAVGGQENGWFEPVFGEVAVFEKKIDPLIFIILSLAAGFFVGVFASLLWHYWKNE